MQAGPGRSTRRVHAANAANAANAQHQHRAAHSRAGGRGLYTNPRF